MPLRAPAAPAAPEHQLDLLAVPAAPEVPADRPAVILETWRRQGSLVVSEEGELQIIGPDGPEPAEVPLRAVPRVKQLCALRDAARRVLHAELANAPDAQITELRTALHATYDDFLRQFGPINLETVGTRSIRRPNLAHFEKDPDAPLVQALEVVNVEEQRYEKAPIFERTVIRPTPEPTSVETPADALAVSLDRRGKVDVPYMARLLGKSDGETIEALAGVIYLDPETDRYETAATYLSGPVKHKLRVVEALARTDKRWQVNVEALTAVQPEPLTEGQIDPSLGAPWIGLEDVREFIAHLLDTAPDQVQLTHDPRQATWSVRVGDKNLLTSARATRQWGTARMHAVALVEAALNQRDPQVMDPIPGTDPRQYVLNPDQTLAAKEQLTAIREEFARWLWSVPERSVRLVEAYNELFNDRVEPVYDGSHLTFPGMSAAVTLRDHQRNAIWRALNNGNTLLAHVVGSGKTYEEIAIAIESRRLGLAKKPCLIVPNVKLDDFIRDTLQLYPTAKVLVGTADDVSPEERRKFAAKVATTDCDLVLMTHNSFLKVPMSPEFERKLLEEEIALYEVAPDGEAKEERTARIKTLARLRERVAAIGRRSEDLGVTFEETGIDMLIVDESDVFKALPIESKNRGRSMEGSRRAEDLELRARYINHRTSGRGVVFGTGTPLNNSIAEVYVIQRFLQRERLASLGLLHFDAWAAQFGESVTSFELAPGGGFRIATRFASFKNAGDLSAIVREVMDVILEEDVKLPVPEVKRRIIALDPTPTQQELLDRILDRAEALQQNRGRRNRNPADGPRDNILKIVHDGRMAALDPRLLDEFAPDEPGGKVDQVARDAVDFLKRTEGDRLTQVLFCDMSTPKADAFHVYGEIRRKMIELGATPEEIAFAQDAKTDKARRRLDRAINEGRIRTVLGSTEVIGVGRNIQARLKRAGHIDVVWTPRAMKQREGRIIRQGNMNEEVEIDTYLVKKSTDAYQLQACERKDASINMFLRGNRALRRIEDIGEVTVDYSMLKAIATGNPLVKEKAELESEVARLTRLARTEEQQRFTAKRELAGLPEKRDRLEVRRRWTHEDLAKRDTYLKEREGKVAEQNAAAMTAYEAALKAWEVDCAQIKETAKAAGAAAEELAAAEAEAAKGRAADMDPETGLTEEQLTAALQNPLAVLGTNATVAEVLAQREQLRRIREDRERREREAGIERRADRAGRQRIQFPPKPRKPDPTTFFEFKYIDGRVTNSREEAGREMLRVMGTVDADGTRYGSSTMDVGYLNGFRVAFEKIRSLTLKLSVIGAGIYDSEIPFDARSSVGIVRRAENVISHLDQAFDKVDKDFTRIAAEAEQLERYLDTPTTTLETLARLTARLMEVDRELGITKEDLAAAMQSEGIKAPAEEAAAGGRANNRHVAGPQAAPAIVREDAGDGDFLIDDVEYLMDAEVVEPDPPAQPAPAPQIVVDEMQAAPRPAVHPPQGRLLEAVDAAIANQEEEVRRLETARQEARERARRAQQFAALMRQRNAR